MLYLGRRKCVQKFRCFRPFECVASIEIFLILGPKEDSSGGSHAGYGGQRSLAGPYDYVMEPVHPGEGGGPPRYQSTQSAPGGGVIRAIVKGRLKINGEISARFFFVFANDFQI